MVVQVVDGQLYQRQLFLQKSDHQLLMLIYQSDQTIFRNLQLLQLLLILLQNDDEVVVHVVELHEGDADLLPHCILVQGLRLRKILLLALAIGSQRTFDVNPPGSGRTSRKSSSGTCNAAGTA